jgi:hypothetical protein
MAGYLFCENVCIVLNLVAKPLLAWQVFGGTSLVGHAQPWIPVGLGARAALHWACPVQRPLRG